MATTERYVDPGVAQLVTQFPRLLRRRQPRAPSALPEGWVELTSHLFADLDDMMDDKSAARFHVLQIKQKFARLRVYWKLGRQQTQVIDYITEGEIYVVRQPPKRPTELFTMIDTRVKQAAEQASRTCQQCGSDGATSDRSGWLMTLCSTCRSNRDADAQSPAQ